MDKDEFTRSWIIETGIPIAEEYGGNLTIRSLYYRLVANGMTNSENHYKRVVAAMIKARWDGLIGFDAFRDHDRVTIGSTPYEATFVEDEIFHGKEQVKAWMNAYSKNKWENQSKYIEVFIEKKALQGVFEGPCENHEVALSPCKGYPSLTFVHDAVCRINSATYEGKEAIILYFGDYDPSGEDIPRSLQDTMDRMGADVHVERILLMEEQVIELNLPPAPTKLTDTRSKNWDGLGQVELDAIEPRELQVYINDAIEEHFSKRWHDELMEQEEVEKAQYRKELKEYVKTL